MNEPSKCTHCGAPLPPDSPEGLCPRCLIALNLATQTEITGETGPAKPPPAPPLPVSDVAKLFPQLEVIECLGRGGMGAVYKARQPRLDRFVALKILSPEKQGNQKFAERFEREARALAKLRHPNIVTVYDFGETHSNFYLLMEFVEGLTLRQLLQNRKLSPPEALVIVPKICDALQYAHSQGIVHRDIKPENILMDKEGYLKIADFGIAKILGDGERANLTEAQAIGTPHYMSPEQIEKPQTVDHRADIYSLGVVFYELLTGELPLGKFQPPSKKVQMDVRLDEIVLRALEKEPERRYQQASEVKTHVETVAATAAPRVRTTDRGSIRTTSQTAGVWNFVAIVAGLAAAVVLIAILGLLAAIAIPNFVSARNHARELQRRQLESKSDYIGQTWFPNGDSIQITSVDRNANIMTVSGRYRLVSHDEARLALYTTSTNSDVPSGPKQVIMIYKGNGDSYDFTLADSHPVSGLPHISMYDPDNHRPFASLYFGTKEEAAQESQADWITNEAPASALTWSPTLAPGEKPDLQKILNAAQSLTDEGSYDDALQHYLWYFDHSKTDPSQRGVRLSFALSYWIELGRRYPKAKQALIEIRDADTRQFENGGYADLFQEIANINHYLEDDDATVTLFKTIEHRDPQLAQECFGYAESTLLQKCDYATCRKYVGDPQEAFDRILRGWEQMKHFEQRSTAQREEQRERFQAMAKTNALFAHIPELPAPPPFADDNFVHQTRQLIEILVATGSKSGAENIQTQALATLNDPRLKTAVQDAEATIAGQNSR